MHGHRRLLLAALLSLTFAGCYSHTTYHKVNPLDALTGKYSEDIILNETVSVWISMIESPGYDATLIEQKCPSRSGSIKKAKGFTSALVQMVTLGIYHSITVEVGCERKAAALNVSPERARALVADARFVSIVRESFPTMAADAERAHVKANAELLASR